MTVNVRYQREHGNGWIAIVEEEDAGDTLTSYVRSPEGQRYDPAPPRGLEGDQHDYQERLERAQARADYMITMATGHAQCSCPPWPEGGD